MLHARHMLLVLPGLWLRGHAHALRSFWNAGATAFLELYPATEPVCICHGLLAGRLVANGAFMVPAFNNRRSVLHDHLRFTGKAPSRLNVYQSRPATSHSVGELCGD